MSHYYTKQITSAERTPLTRILAVVPIEAEWTDSRSKKKIKAVGETQNIGESTALVNIHPLPQVGDEIKLKVSFEGKTLAETKAEVLRIQRDLVQPLAALSIVDAEEKWETAVWGEAQAIATSQMIPEEEEFIN